jgi:hypothetical protein
MKESERPPAPRLSRCVPPGMIGYEEFKRQQQAEAAFDRQTIRTGRTREVRCVICGLAMISEELLLRAGGHPVWQTRHPDCEMKPRKPKQKSTRHPNADP